MKKIEAKSNGAGSGSVTKSEYPKKKRIKTPNGKTVTIIQHSEKSNIEIMEELRNIISQYPFIKPWGEENN